MKRCPGRFKLPARRRILPEGAANVSKRRDLLIVIADGEHARFVRPAADNALHADRGFDSLSAHKRSAELGSDHPGASFHSDSSAHHAITPRHDLHALEKEKFAHLIGASLNAAAGAGQFSELVLVAPPHVLAAMRATLDTTTGAMVVGTLGKDLIKVPDHELQPHLAEWVHPVHRPHR
ncbi:MAG: host attachment protein [Rhodospirillales bacterium]|nr:host attachment protein [Rhodospirillales bacterium]MDE2200607.1 host attachment protein [Rhodospirillales bacterium]MDE2575978.1 host attachment protein [Rhodospirillales bacterium]